MSFTPDEVRLMADEQFFMQKARIMNKVRALLDELHGALADEIAGAEFVAPSSFDIRKFQFVKGEHLEHYPYQYLDFPKHFDGAEKFRFDHSSGGAIISSLRSLSKVDVCLNANRI